ENQVVSIFAGTNGFLDEIPVEHVGRYEREMLEMMELKHPDLLAAIAEKKDLTDDIVSRLKSTLREFTDSFKVSVNA
ncbi:MAG: F0F1 ATP synthase subunit alpha, partial [Bacteroidota bacterium]